MFKLLKFLLGTIVFIIITGGYKFQIGKAKVDLTNTDVPGLLFLLLISIGYIFKLEYFLKIKKFMLVWYAKITEEKNSRSLFNITLLYLTVTTFLGHVFKQYSFQSHGLDQVFIHQPLFYPWFKEKLLFCSVCPNNTFFGEHINFTFLLVAPLTSLFKSDILVFLINVFLLYGGMYLLITKGPLRNKANYWFVSLLILCSARTYRNAGIWDLREDHFAFFFMVLALIAIYRKNISIYFMSVVLVLISKENMSYLVPFLIFPLLLEKDLDYSKKARVYLSLGTVMLSLIWMKLSFAYVFPYFNNNMPPSANIVDRFDGIAKSTGELVIKILTDYHVQKKLIVERVLTVGGIKYVAILLLPFLISCRKRWYWIIAASPIIGMNLLSYAGTQKMMIFHYDLVIIPILSMGVLYAIKNHDKYLPVYLLAALMVSGRWPSQYLSKNVPSGTTYNKVKFLKSIDTKERVCTSWKNLAYLSHLEDVCVLTFNSLTREDFYKENYDRAYYGGAVKKDSLLIIDLSEQKQASIYKIIRKEYLVIKESPTLLLLRPVAF
ncbi:DUF2079 domain-containing protein [Bacteriovorax sp. Seq25_V]|uniref:DUF2079 domain-containing protein n=1 Tax=Bacteriovorax sp. Seq25_V TaxID=1201288 RepID=UPI000389F32A|nr:DUF2079 domain-containing protein [Bacteriovorax sp. Seq25_V]EQC43257.1 membrane protein, PF09852 family [Bacteriovorax sp. Seq25_V]